MNVDIEITTADEFENNYAILNMKKDIYRSEFENLPDNNSMEIIKEIYINVFIKIKN